MEKRAIISEVTDDRKIKLQLIVIQAAWQRYRWMRRQVDVPSHSERVVVGVQLLPIDLIKIECLLGERRNCN